VLFDETGLAADRIRSLRLIIWSVAIGTICFNITAGIAMTGYLKAIGVTDFVYGLLFAMAPAANALQIFTSYLLERTRARKRIFITAGLIQRFVWLPFGLVPFFVPMSAPLVRVWIVTLLMLVNALCAPFMNVSFFSMLADVAPIRIRGRYLSVRQRISTIIGIFGGLTTAWLLDMFPGFYGYAFVFTLAFLAGTTDIVLFFWVKFPPMQKKEKHDSIIKMISEVFRNKQFLRVTGFVAIWGFSLNLSGPFYLVYARTVLNLSNTVITLVSQILPNICSVIIIARWGHMMDKRGTKHVMLTTGRLSSIMPLLWFFISPGPLSIVLMAISNISGGLLASGMDVASQNAFLNRSPEKNRSMYVAMYFCVTALIGTGLANTIGGWLLDNPLRSLETAGFSMLGVVFNRYNYLFLLTFIMRFMASYLLLPRMVTNDVMETD